MSELTYFSYSFAWVSSQTIYSIWLVLCSTIYLSIYVSIIGFLSAIYLSLSEFLSWNAGVYISFLECWGKNFKPFFLFGVYINIFKFAKCDLIWDINVFLHNATTSRIHFLNFEKLAERTFPYYESTCSPCSYVKGGDHALVLPW